MRLFFPLTFRSDEPCELNTSDLNVVEFTHPAGRMPWARRAHNASKTSATTRTPTSTSICIFERQARPPVRECERKWSCRTGSWVNLPPRLGAHVGQDDGGADRVAVDVVLGPLRAHHLSRHKTRCRGHLDQKARGGGPITEILQPLANTTFCAVLVST